MTKNDSLLQSGPPPREVGSRQAAEGGRPSARLYEVGAKRPTTSPTRSQGRWIQLPLGIGEPVPPTNYGESHSELER